MSAAWFCPACQRHHAPHVETCPGSEPKPVKRATEKRVWFCPECHKPEGECDPEGVGHYRG